MGKINMFFEVISLASPSPSLPELTNGDCGVMVQDLIFQVKGGGFPFLQIPNGTVSEKL